MVDVSDIAITIPYPSHLPRGRGIDAINRGNAKLIVDHQPQELLLIDQAAAKAGLTRAAYVRWVLVHASKEVMR